eukprot:953294-Karenia_brevis.AAC.1
MGQQSHWHLVQHTGSGVDEPALCEHLCPAVVSWCSWVPSCLLGASSLSTAQSGHAVSGHGSGSRGHAQPSAHALFPHG